jgi:ferredoxin-NADP reductase
MPPFEDKFFRARITHRREIAHELWVIRLKPDGEVDFAAGQYATLGVWSQESHAERAYSLVSSPYERELEVFVELVPDGELTPLLHAWLGGSEVTRRTTAKGHFTLDLRSGHKNHLLLCTVTGVAPYVSYARTLYKDWKENHFPGDFTFTLSTGRAVRGNLSIETNSKALLQRFLGLARISHEK